MPQEIIDRIAEAEDVLIHISSDIPAITKNKEIFRRLDNAISELENLLYYCVKEN